MFRITRCPAVLRLFSTILFATSIAVVAAMAPARAADPIRIGFSMSLTGGLAPLGKVALITMKLWEEDINAKGGLLGRPVQLVHYDDQTSASNVPGIYSKLLDVDKVDLVIGPFATNMTAPAMPVVMQKKKVLISIYSTAVNTEFNYDRYFSMIPLGPRPKTAFTEAFFEVAAKQDPKPRTIAIVAGDGEATHFIAEGARENAKKFGLEIVYDQTYPLSTADLTPLARSLKAKNPDLVLISSYPIDSVAMVRAINEIGFTPKLVGGAMNGIPSPGLKAQLGPLLNGFVNYEFWLPVGDLDTPEAKDLVKRYRERAVGQGVDPVGLYLPPWAYSYIQILGEAIKATNSLDDGKIADHIRKTTFSTLVGKVKFGPGGEWDQSRMLLVQYRGVKGNDIDQFKDLSTFEILWPEKYATGKAIYPYEKAK